MQWSGDLERHNSRMAAVVDRAGLKGTRLEAEVHLGRWHSGPGWGSTSQTRPLSEWSAGQHTSSSPQVIFTQFWAFSVLAVLMYRGKGDLVSSWFASRLELDNKP